MIGTLDFVPGSAAVTFVTASAYGGAAPTSKSADAHQVAGELLARYGSEGCLLAAHAIYGIADLLLLVKGESFVDLLHQLNSKIRIKGQEVGRNCYISGTSSYLITSWFGKPLARSTFELDRSVSAWLSVVVGVGDPAEVAEKLIRIEGVEIAAPVLGCNCDLFVYAKHQTHDGLQWIVDEEIRKLRDLVSTSTLLVTRKLPKKPQQ
jgi:hypothetical protein